MKISEKDNSSGKQQVLHIQPTEVQKQSAMRNNGVANSRQNPKGAMTAAAAALLTGENTAASHDKGPVFYIEGAMTATAAALLFLLYCTYSYNFASHHK